jgi:hypothetical protein
MAARDRANIIGHGENRKAKGERYARQANADSGESSRQNCASAAAKDEPECAEKFSRKLVLHRNTLFFNEIRQ